MSSADPSSLAYSFVQHSSRHIFLTGKAGTGKTTFLKRIMQNTHKKAVIAAPTGIAAINAGGMTIHSLFQLPFGSFLPEEFFGGDLPDNVRFHTPTGLLKMMRISDRKRKLLRETELLIIDEVSMLRADLLDAIDLVLKSIRRDKRSFGGVQVLFIGDLMQLPPVVKPDEWNILKNFYPGLYFFQSKVLTENPPVHIELEKVYRQEDDHFLTILNNLRNNRLTSENIEQLNRYYKPGFQPGKNDAYITLTTHNHKADQINRQFLDSTNEKSFFFKAEIKNDFPENIYPLDASIELKKGAQVMFIKNDPTGQQRFFNGMIGVIEKISEEKVFVKTENQKEPLQVEPYEWENIRFEAEETTGEIKEKVIGTFTQLPLRLAWAITVHKSQGLTFSKAIIDPQEAFAPGQVYVALSRLRSLDGLVLTSKIPERTHARDHSISIYSESKPTIDQLVQISDRETKNYLFTFIPDAFHYEHISSMFKRICKGNSQEETTGIRKRDHEWQNELQVKIDPLTENSRRFHQQLQAISQQQWPQSLDFLTERVKAASDYFLPRLWEISSDLIVHLAVLQAAKKSKEYFSDIFHFEEEVYSMIRKVVKANQLCHAIKNREELTKNSFAEEERDTTRKKMISNLLNKTTTEDWGDAKSAKRKTTAVPKKKKAPKEAQPATREKSFELFKQGKSIEEIAAIRELAFTTIASHLATFITEGRIEISELMDSSKIEPIQKVIEQLETTQLSPVKEKLGDEFDYHEIRFVMNYMQRKLLLGNED